MLIKFLQDFFFRNNIGPQQKTWAPSLVCKYFADFLKHLFPGKTCSVYFCFITLPVSSFLFSFYLLKTTK